MNVTIGIRAHDINILNKPDDLFAELARLSVQQVQLAPAKSFPALTNNGEQITETLAKEINKAATTHNVKVAVLGCYINLIHPDEVLRQQLLQRVKGYLARAGAIGASVVATETGSIDPSFKFTTDNFTEQPFQAVLESIRQIMPAAEQNDIDFAIEPGLNHPIYSIATTKRVLANIASPNLNVLLDPASLVYHGKNTDEIEIIKEAFAAFGDKIVAVHLKDYVFDEQGLIKIVVPGMGLAPLHKAIKTVTNLAPNVPILMDELPSGTVNEAIDKMREIVAAN